MGLVHADITLINTDDLALVKAGYRKPASVRSMQVRALVDSGAYMLAINEKLKTQLGLDVLETRPAESVDGRIVDLEVVGPVDVHVENRTTTVRAMVLPGDAEVLLGAIPMEDMDVLIDPREQKLIANPQHPLRPQVTLK